MSARTGIALAAYHPKLRNYLVSHHDMAFDAISGSATIDRFGYRECPRK